MAASVSTRVVSWNDAADSHESVASDALVMPMSSGRPSAGRARLDQSRFISAEDLLVDPLAGQEVGVARLLHADAAGHLAHDQLDVLVVDRHALVAVHLLHLFDEVQLGLADALDLHELLGIARAVDDGIAGVTSSPSATVEAGEARRCSSPRCRRRHDRDDRPLPSSSAMRTTPDVRARRAAPFGRAGLEQLDDAGQTAGDVASPATPPVWNVRIVSCVPGSPMDCAAMTPTASPSSIGLPVASERP